MQDGNDDSADEDTKPAEKGTSSVVKKGGMTDYIAH